MTLRYLSQLLLALTVWGCSSDPSGPAGSGASTADAGEAGAGGRAQTGGESDVIPGDAGDAGSVALGPSDAGGGVPGEAGATSDLPGNCWIPQASLALPARSSALSSATAPPDLLTYVADIQRDFDEHCGNCHVETTSGTYHVDHLTVDLATRALARIKIESTVLSMPQGPELALFSARSGSDPIVRLANELQLWLDNGSPPDVIRTPQPRAIGMAPYVLSPKVGTALTDLGSCIPDAGFPFAQGKPYQKKMDGLDAMFAGLARDPPGDNVAGANQLGLPEHLSQTDLVSLDSALLARYGVIAFAPGYPLWSDGSGKLRFIRVPRGTSVRFDRATQEFSIPPNTRFYKTFLKQVTDLSGKQSFRKIETRLIVSRPDISDTQPGALFGTYLWNDDETEATLVTDNLRDTTPFKDLELSYITDELIAREILNRDPPVKNLPYELDKAHATRHYAIPGKERCFQCHRGSVRGDFVLGFTPLQIWRRPTGSGGVIEPTGPDEMSQLERLVSLGVITGLASSADLVPLEESQGLRKPRNELELVAQGYLFGNCAHCHNPRGDASKTVPELESLLNFWPNAQGGIFEFPLDRTSPRTFRGIEGRAIPYITPSLRDLVPYSWDKNVFYTPKWDPDGGYDADGLATAFWDAPWRSLIYRNTQTPFTYADDYTIFPHMPRNTAGHDCRASQLLGSWMVSIPARRKASVAALSEDYVGQTTLLSFNDLNHFPGDSRLDNESQPFEEARPGDADYQTAALEARARLQIFQNGVRYNTCPDSSDVVDPEIESTQNITGVPRDKAAPLDGTPDHTHWVNTDLTEKPGDYELRRTDWQDVLVNRNFPALDPKDVNADAKQAAEKDVVNLLTTIKGGVTFDAALLGFASTPFPIALWQTKPSCDFSKVKQVSDFTPDEAPLWIRRASKMGLAIAPNAPVFSKLPGGAVYDMICTNCHGANLDSRGRQAETVELLTGGSARVANFRAGLFGPESQPGAQRRDVFGAVVSSSASVDDWTARYMSWMALGGTRQHIPTPVLELVSKTDVAGSKRAHPLIDPSAVTANMLSAAETACGQLGGVGVNVDFNAWGSLFGYAAGRNALIQTNGDAELWQRLCTLNNPPPVHGIFITRLGTLSFDGLFDPSGDLQTARIGNQLGAIETGISTGNLFPWCIEPTSDPVALSDFLAKNSIDGEPPPICPDALAAKSWASTGRFDQWRRRGAINAGFSVAYFIDQVTRGLLKPLLYNQCDQLGG